MRAGELVGRLGLDCAPLQEGAGCVTMSWCHQPFTNGRLSLERCHLANRSPPVESPLAWPWVLCLRGELGLWPCLACFGAQPPPLQEGVVGAWRGVWSSGRARRPNLPSACSGASGPAGSQPWATAAGSSLRTAPVSPWQPVGAGGLPLGRWAPPRTPASLPPGFPA